jgi:nucleotide-binding universal stress UspA family protein
MDYAWSLSREFQAKLSIAHIGESDQNFPKASIAVREFFQTWQERSGSKEAPGAILPEFMVDVGSPADRILQMASEQRADLIVLGIRGVSCIQARIFAHLAGRTADKIGSGSSCPVLTIRQKPRRHPTKHGSEVG